MDEMTNIIQWNCQGVRSKKDEILDLIQNYKPLLVALQETKRWENNKFEIAGYTCIRKDCHFNHTPHGEVGLYVNQSVPFRQLQFQTDEQALATQIDTGQLITICKVYTSGRHNFRKQIVQNLIDQLPVPYLILGDFNGHNFLWGNQYTDHRGRIVEKLVNDNNCHILNEGAMTSSVRRGDCN